ICKIIEKELNGKINISNHIIENSRTKQKLNFWADTRKSARVLSWYPRVDISAGIRQYIKSLEE
ncbi:MAG: hypothetical protein NT033_00405, partial [Candidatus Omnitrophica bacterium]|nr:hypothetical protein [Candidatus Omnitrophota bacterium]